MRHLDRCHPNSRDHLANDGGIVGRIEGTIQFQQLTDLIEMERRLRCPEPAQEAVDPTIDVLSSARPQNRALSQSSDPAFYPRSKPRQKLRVPSAPHLLGLQLVRNELRT